MPTALTSDSFTKNEVEILDQFLPRELAQALYESLLAAQRAGHFQPARIGRDQARLQNNEARADAIYWLDEKNSDSQESFLRRMSDLKMQLREKMRLNLDSMEFHAAYYARGTFYEKHRDQFRHEALTHLRSHRLLSLVYYLNPHWQPGDGGELSLEAGADFVRIEPRFNRLVIFKSEKLHEVLPVKSEGRFSIAGWFKSAGI